MRNCVQPSVRKPQETRTRSSAPYVWVTQCKHIWRWGYAFAFYCVANGKLLAKGVIVDEHKQPKLKAKQSNKPCAEATNAPRRLRKTEIKLKWRSFITRPATTRYVERMWYLKIAINKKNYLTFFRLTLKKMVCKEAVTWKRVFLVELLYVTKIKMSEKNIFY